MGLVRGNTSEILDIPLWLPKKKQGVSVPQKKIFEALACEYLRDLLVGTDTRRRQWT